MTDEPAEVQALQERIEELEAEIDRLEAENAELDDRVADLEAEFDPGELEELQAENDRLETENAALEGRIDELELESQIGTDSESRVEELEREVELLETDNAELSDRINELDDLVPGSEESEDTTSGRGSDEERVYLASKTRQHFHRPDCEWAKYIPDYKLIEFSSHAEAVAAGKKPCKTCRA